MQRKEVKKKTNEYFIKSLNLIVQPTSKNNGVIILQVEDYSNLNVGDIIIEVNRELISTIDSFVKLVEEIYKTGRHSLLLKVIRNEKSLWVTIQFE